MGGFVGIGVIFLLFLIWLDILASKKEAQNQSDHLYYMKYSKRKQMKKEIEQAKRNDNIRKDIKDKTKRMKDRDII